MTTKYKIGDRVREIDTGDIGTVTKIEIDYFGETDYDEVCALWDKTGKEAWFDADSEFFEVVQPVSTETSIRMSSKHVHAKLIMQWAQGAKIEYQDNGEWFPIDRPSWDTKILYRVAPLRPIATKWIVSNPECGFEKRVSNDKYLPNDPAMLPFISRGWIFHSPVKE